MTEEPMRYLMMILLVLVLSVPSFAGTSQFSIAQNATAEMGTALRRTLFAIVRITPAATGVILWCSTSQTDPSVSGFPLYGQGAEAELHDTDAAPRYWCKAIGGAITGSLIETNSPR